MNSDRLKSDIEEVKGDVRLLLEEVETLKKEEADLLDEIRVLQLQLDQDDDNNNEMSNHGRRNIDDIGTRNDVPIPIIRHDRFDASIRKYFGKEDSKYDSSIIDNWTSTVAQRAEKMVELKENIMYENIFRLGGITGFPLNRFLFDESDEIFGIRFDNFNGFNREFLIPHYVILRKIDITTKNELSSRKWSIFKHTLPVYVPYNHYEVELQNSNLHENEALLNFAISIRNFLVSTQYKHDKLDLLLNMSMSSFNGSDSKIFTKIDKDLQAQRIVLHLKCKQSKPHQIELICSDNLIEIVNITLNVKKRPNDLILVCESILRNTTFNDFKKNIRKVVDQLEKNNLL